MTARAGAIRVGDRVMIWDCDGFGEEGAWLRGTVGWRLGRGRFRVLLDCGGVLDGSVRKGQIKAIG